uniref:low-specificity L-threonine aldolase n=1 Tax=Candidozyma auris TaxID=498019 RepID=A0A0L0NPL5_CANAR
MSVDLSNFAESPASNEFRSDTFTTPTVAMVSSLANCTLGDAVYNEDKSTTRLEDKVAQLAGKEAGLFCVSGTLLNQIALRTNLFQPPHGVLCDHRSHVYVNEAGGLPTLSQAMVQSVAPKNGIHLTLKDDILPNFVPDDGEIHGCPTKVISLENTLHGMLFPLEEIKKISAFCKENDVRLHLDGARLWNASSATGIPLAEYCSYFDSVSLCLSKSLGAPIGSVLVGSSQFIKKANHFRKQNGGGIRQSGLLAEMASVAIDDNFSKLTRVHEKAKEVGQFCEELGFVLEHPVDTNFVFIDLAASKINNDFFVKAAEKHNVKAYGSRLAFHFQNTDEAIENLKIVLQETAEEAKKNPYNTTEVQKLYSVYDSK